MKMFASAMKKNDNYKDYLFDENIIKYIEDWFVVPSLFRNDDLNVLGPDMRPSYRWLLIGSSGSGTPFHVDPFGTSAWNYCVKGKKLWIMYPPSEIPPHVDDDDDDDDDDCDPRSLLREIEPLKWISKFCPRKQSDGKVIIFVQSEDELVFVPAGWWHLVLNIEDETIAVTQNFLTTHNRSLALEHMKASDLGSMAKCFELAWDGKINVEKLDGLRRSRK